MIIRIKENPDRSFWWTVLLLAFMCHGILYFLSGAANSYYSYENPIKAIKYLIVFAGLVLAMVGQCRVKLFALLPIGISIILMACSQISHKQFADYIVLANYCVPIFTVFLYPQISKKTNLYRIITFTYVFSSIVGYVEFLFLKGKFGIFADVGYRACSIFINPNNYAAFIFLSSTIILMNRTGALKKTVLLVNSYVLLGMSGSRSGLVMMTVSVFLLCGYLLIKKFSIKETRWVINAQIIVICILLCMAVLFMLIKPDLIIDKITTLLDGGRKIGDIDLKDGRFYQIEAFFTKGDFNFLFPNLNSEVYTDNLFLHLWGFFGLGILLLYIILTIYVIVRLWKYNKKQSFLLILLFLFGMFENYLYLWPVAYVYWFLIASAFYRDGDEQICTGEKPDQSE